MAATGMAQQRTRFAHRTPIMGARSGLTLVELLAAMVVLLVGVYAVAALFPKLSGAISEEETRTTIARAILVDPVVMILDDATSSVDTETEDEINSRIKSVLTDRTAIIISHRVSSVKEADRIIYLDDGRIAEQGTHDELLDKEGVYYKLHSSAEGH